MIRFRYISREEFESRRWKKTKHRWDDWEDRYLNEQKSRLTTLEIAQELNRSIGSVKQRYFTLGINKPRVRVRHAARWLPHELDYLRKHAHDKAYTEIAADLGRSHGSTKQKARQIGIRKETNPGCYPKGHTPWNKGKKGILVSEGCKKGWFKPGHTPANSKYDGCISIRDNHGKKGGPTLWIRINGKWIYYSRHVWESHKGPIPKGCVIRHKDGNQLNNALDNLECITMAENSRRNNNPEKMVETCRRTGSGSYGLSDNYVAGCLTHGDPDLRKYLLKHRPDIIEIARLNMKLKRAIKQKVKS